MIKQYQKGEVIFHEGVYESCMYRLIEGSVAVYARYGRENQMLLTEKCAENKDYFGEMELVEVMPRSATVVATSDITVELITSDSFGQYFEKHPEQVYDILTQLGRRIRQINSAYMETCRAAAELEGSSEDGGWLMDALKRMLHALEAYHG